MNRGRLDDGRARSALDPATAEWRSRPGLRDAAVLVPVFCEGGEDHLLYTLRRADLPSHPGEMSFPGGAREATETALECALRESREEVGLDPSTVDVLGRLPERVSIGGFLVHVFVGRLASVVGLTPDPGEVERIVTIPLADLHDPTRWEWRPVRGPTLRAKVPFFTQGSDTLWGLTGILTLDLLARLEGRRPAPR